MTHTLPTISPRVEPYRCAPRPPPRAIAQRFSALTQLGLGLARPRFRPRTATVRRFTTDGLSQASYRATRDGSAIDYVLKRPAVLVGSAWPGGEQGKCHANGRA